MHLGQRCDEIVRMIEETLAEAGIDGDGPGSAAPVTPLSQPARPRAANLRTTEHPEPAAAGF